jgi:hypothetical protein
MSFNGLRNGVAIGLLTVANLGRKATNVVVGIFLGTESDMTLTTESGDLLLIEPVV